MRSSRQSEDIEALAGKPRPELAPDPRRVSKSREQNYRRAFPRKMEVLKARTVCRYEATLNAGCISYQWRCYGMYDRDWRSCRCLTMQSCRGN
jgi:hypothetical protein